MNVLGRGQSKHRHARGQLDEGIEVLHNLSTASPLWLRCFVLLKNGPPSFAAYRCAARIPEVRRGSILAGSPPRLAESQLPRRVAHLTLHWPGSRKEMGSKPEAAARMTILFTNVDSFQTLQFQHESPLLENRPARSGPTRRCVVTRLLRAMKPKCTRRGFISKPGAGRENVESIDLTL